MKNSKDYEEAIEEGRKYKLILEELEEELETRSRFVIPDEYCSIKGGVVKDLIKTLKEKYFPAKPIRKTFIIELEEGKKGVMDRVIKDFKNGKLGNWCVEAVKVKKFEEEETGGEF